MKQNYAEIFITGAGKLALVTDAGRAFLGLKKSSSPELRQRAVSLFEHMDSRYWGVLDLNNIRGKALLIYWSWDSEEKAVRFDRLGNNIN